MKNIEKQAIEKIMALIEESTKQVALSVNAIMSSLLAYRQGNKNRTFTK